MMHLVSVVIPTYNRVSTLQIAIESVLCQTYRNIEIIVVDDKSDDYTLEYLKSITDSRVKFVQLHENKGGAYARNIGVENSTGSLIAFLDSDDYWQSEKLSEQVKCVPNFGDWIIYNKVLCKQNERDFFFQRLPFIPNTHNIFDYLIADKNFIQTSGLLMPRQIALAFPFNEKLRRHQDLDLIIRMVDAGLPLLYCDYPGVYWTFDSANTQRVSSGNNVAPTLYWINQYKRRLPRRSLAELWAVQVAPRLIKKKPLVAIVYLLAGLCLSPRIAVRLVSKLYKIRFAK